MICKACTKCMEYIILHDGHQSELIEYRFDSDHREHPVVIIPESELSHYHIVNDKYRHHKLIQV